MSRFISKDLNAPSGAFGEVLTGELTPQVQLEFGTFIAPQLGTTTTVGASASAAIDTTNKVLKLQTGAATNSKAIFESVQPATYHPGQGSTIRFTTINSTGVTGSNQFAGVGDSSDGFFVGYQGEEFGVLRRVGGHPEIQTLTVTTAADAGGGDFTITFGDDGTSGAITVGAAATVSEIVEEIIETDFTNLGWKAFHSDVDKATPQTTATVYFRAIESEVKSGSFTLNDVDAGTAGTFAQSVAGVAPTNNFIAQADFNIDNLDGTGEVQQTIDLTKGNVFEIRYQWLGFGKIDFFIEDPDTGLFALMHEIKYANTATSPSIFNPTLPLRAEVENTTNNTNVSLSIGSFAAFAEGTKKTPARTFLGASNSIALTDNTEIPVISLKNDLIFQGEENRIRVAINSASVSLAAQTGGQTAVVVFRARSNVFLTSDHGAASTTTNFVSFDVSKGWNFIISPVRIDTTSDGVDISTLVKAGVEQFAVSLGGEGANTVFDLGENFDDALLAPGTYFAITAERIAGGNVDVDVAVNWSDIYA
jgi:hypothetical protein